MKHYYNTNDLNSKELQAAIKSNAAQQDKVLELFSLNPGVSIATFQVREMLMPNAPHTSAQRCITNLTDVGLLQKTDDYVQGPYGKKVHTWKLA